LTQEVRRRTEQLEEHVKELRAEAEPRATDRMFFGVLWLLLRSGSELSNKPGTDGWSDG
jgi:hypothetical protein